MSKKVKLIRIKDGKEFSVDADAVQKIKDNPNTKGLYRFPKETPAPPEAQNLNRPADKQATKDTPVELGAGLKK